MDVSAAAAAALPRRSRRVSSVRAHQADRRGAAFATAYANTEQTIAVRFTELEVLLHEEAILSLLEFAAGLQAALAVDEPPPPPGGATDVAATEAAGRNVTAAAAAVAAASTATTLGQRSTGEEGDRPGRPTPGMSPPPGQPTPGPGRPTRGPDRRTPKPTPTSDCKCHNTVSEADCIEKITFNWIR